MEITKANVEAVLRNVIDPELGINIVDLGLVYGVRIRDQSVCISMTMTTPACPLHSYMDRSIQESIRAHFSNVKSVEVALVWEPPWHPAMMSTEAKHQLGWKLMNNFSLEGEK